MAPLPRMPLHTQLVSILPGANIVDVAGLLRNLSLFFELIIRDWGTWKSCGLSELPAALSKAPLT